MTTQDIEPEMYQGYELSFTGWMRSNNHPELGTFGFGRAYYINTDNLNIKIGGRYTKPNLVFRIKPDIRTDTKTQLSLHFAFLRNLIDVIGIYGGTPMTIAEWNDYLEVSGWEL